MTDLLWTKLSAISQNKKQGRETGGRAQLDIEAEVLCVELDRCIYIIDYVTYADRGHGWSFFSSARRKLAP